MTTEIFVDEKYFGNERFGIVTVALESLKITPRKYSDNDMVIEVGSTGCPKKMSECQTIAGNQECINV